MNSEAQSRILFSIRPTCAFRILDNDTTEKIKTNNKNKNQAIASVTLITRQCKYNHTKRKIHVFN